MHIFKKDQALQIVYEKAQVLARGVGGRKQQKSCFQNQLKDHFFSSTMFLRSISTI